MKPKIVLLYIVSVLLFLQGCGFPEKYPIEGTQNILIGGIDVDGDDVVLTAYVDDISQSSKPGEERISYSLYVSKGKTVYEAGNNLHTFNKKYLSWFHTKYIILGEEAAKSGIDRLLCFFTEDNETRLLYKVIVVRGMTAKDFLQLASSMKVSLADYFDTLFDIGKKTGKTREIHLINYAIDRETPWNDLFIPAVELLSNPVGPSASDGGSGGKGESQSGQESDTEYLIKLGGFALFDGDKLSGFLEDNMALSLNILNNELLGAQITVAGKNGSNVSLETLRCSTGIKTGYYPMSVAVEVNIDLNLVEYQSADDPMDNEDMTYIQQQADEYLKGRIMQTIGYMQEVKSDAAGIGDKFYHSDPVKWQEIKDKWKDIFPNVQFSVKVNTKIRSVYELEHPIK
jgi:spore germination protein KC